MSLKLRVEAALFLTDKPLTAAAAAQLVNEDVQVVRQAILELIHDYEERNSALEIADDGGYMMQIKDEYATIANDIAPIDLPVSVVRTLSAIAIKQPVLQSEVVRIRGAGAYEHVKELLEKDLIIKKEEGRSALLSTTKRFQEYFRLSQDAKALRFQLKEQTEGEKETESVVAPNESDQLSIPFNEPSIDELSVAQFDDQQLNNELINEPASESANELTNEQSVPAEENNFAGPAASNFAPSNI